MFMKIKKGTILIAEPFMEDPNFKEAVILLVDDVTEHGTVGFILNKPIDMDMHQLVADFPEVSSPVYFGGPVGHDTIHYIHTLGEEIDDSLAIDDNYYWGGNFEQIKAMIAQNSLDLNQIKFFVGYSGWSPNQLDSELKLGSWVTDDMNQSYFHNIQNEKLWELTMKNKGDSFGIIAEMPKSISWN